MPIGVTTVALLSTLSWSVVCANVPTVAEMGWFLPASTRTTMVMLAEAPDARFGPVQLTLEEPEGDGFTHVHPAGAVTDSNVVPPGIPMETRGEAAESGPALVTVAV